MELSLSCIKLIRKLKIKRIFFSVLQGTLISLFTIGPSQLAEASKRSYRDPVLRLKLARQVTNKDACISAMANAAENQISSEVSFITEQGASISSNNAGLSVEVVAPNGQEIVIVSNRPGNDSGVLEVVQTRVEQVDDLFFSVNSLDSLSFPTSATIKLLTQTEEVSNQVFFSDFLLPKSVEFDGWKETIQWVGSEPEDLDVPLFPITNSSEENSIQRDDNDYQVESPSGANNGPPFFPGSRGTDDPPSEESPQVDGESISQRVDRNRFKKDIRFYWTLTGVALLGIAAYLVEHLDFSKTPKKSEPIVIEVSFGEETEPDARSAGVNMEVNNKSIKTPSEEVSMASIKVDVRSIMNMEAVVDFGEVEAGFSSKLGSENVTKAQAGGGSAFMGISTGNANRVLVLIDISGSMAGAKLEMLKSEVVKFIGRLKTVKSIEEADPKKDKMFTVAPFNTDISLKTCFSKTLVYATAHNKSAAASFVKRLNATGGTNFKAAAEVAILLDPQVIFFVTDGIDSTSADMSRILKEQGNGIVVHNIGVGVRTDGQLNGVDGKFLKELADQTKGSARTKYAK